MTAEQLAAKKKRIQERKAAEKALQDRLTKSEASCKEMAETLSAVQKKLGMFEGFEPKDILAKIEEVKASTKQVEEKIRKNKGGLYVPGIEDEAKNFSMLKAVVGSASEWKMFKDTKEHEIVKEATKVARNTAGIDSEGGFFIPDQVIPDVIGALYQESVMLALDASTGRTRVSVITGLGSPKVRIPKFKSGMLAYWIGEKKAYTPTEPDAGVVTMDAKKMGLATTITEEMANRANYGFESLLRNDMQRVASAELDRVILYGSGSGFEPRGVVNFPNVQRFYFETSSKTAPVGTAVGARSDWAKMNLMILALEEAKIALNGSAAWVSSPRFFRDLANLRTLNFSGQDESMAPFLAALPPLTMEALRSLLGDYAKTTLIPGNNAIAGTGAGAETKYTDLFHGNWSEFIVGRWGGVEVLTDQGLSGENWLHDKRSIKMRMYVDTGCRHEEALIYARDVRVAP